QLLYQASQAGVKVDLLVRGICCLRPGVPGISDNIRVISIVGRFLEHSRLYYFYNNGHEEVYVGSADIMPRNIDHRVEVLFPIESPQLIQHLRDDVLAVYLNDTAKARRLLADGTYELIAPKADQPPLNSQAWLIAHRPNHLRSEEI
ncbi:partial Polyphosphate kinase, partial [Anaerolineae bacterium]